MSTMLVPFAAYNFVFRNIMKVTGKIIEQVEENWWALVTDSKTIVIYCEEKLTKV